MAFDDVLRKYVGEFGRHQILVTLVLNILSIPGSFDVMEIIFSQATPPFWLKGELLRLKIWIRTRAHVRYMLYVLQCYLYISCQMWVRETLLSMERRSTKLNMCDLYQNIT